MIINDVNLVNVYGVTIISREIQNSNVINYVDWLESALLPNRIKNEKFTYSECKVVLLVEGDSEISVLSKISNIVNLCKNGVVKFTDLDLHFNFQLLNSSNKKIYSDAYELTLNMQINYKYKSEMVKSYNEASFSVINSGNLTTPCRLELTPTVNSIDVTITGFSDSPIIIKNLVKGKTITFDEGTVTQDGSNKFSDIIMWEFPRLIPGSNSITLSRDTIATKVIYKEMII